MAENTSMSRFHVDFEIELRLDMYTQVQQMQKNY